ncbi:MAG: AN1-type zinc finger domain-containing protein [Nitrososphaerales archaeon]
MNRCSFCGKEEFLPFTCPYCKENFCTEHRLPENHNCSKLWLAKKARSPWFPLKTSRSFTNRASFNFSRSLIKTEVKHLLIAWLVLGFAFSLTFLFRFPSIFLTMLGISLLTVGLGFIIHELAHKFSAQRYGYWAEFRMSPWGLALALIFAFISGGSFIFAAPGATLIAPSSYSSTFIGKRENGIISLVGPLTNVALAFLFYLLTPFGGLIQLIGIMGFKINLWLAAFNLIPFGGLDGAKVLSWSIFIWLIVAIPIWLSVFFLFFL